MRATRVLVWALSGAVLTASAVTGASAAPSDGVRLLSTVGAPGAVSARLVVSAGRARYLYVSTAASLLVYDLADPASPKEVGRLPLPTYQNEDLDGNVDVALLADDVPVAASDSPAGGQLVVTSMTDKTRPQPIAVASLPDGAGHTATCLLGCRWLYTSGGASLAAVDVSNPAQPIVTRVALPEQTGIVHDADVDKDGVVWLAGQQGLAAVAVSPVTRLGSRVATLSRSATPERPVVLTSTGRAGTTPAVSAGTLHGSLRPTDVRYDKSSGLAPGDVLLAGEEGTATDCRDGGRFHVFDARGLRDGRELRLLDSVAPAEAKSTAAPGLGAGCSAHWFTTQGSLAAVAWFGAGLRILDFSNPRKVRQVGRYVPTEPRTWSAYWIPGTRYVYALDLHRGIDVLEVTANVGGVEVGALDHARRARSVSDLANASLCAPWRQHHAPTHRSMLP